MKWNQEDRSLHSTLWIAIGKESSKPSTGNLHSLWARCFSL